MFSSNMNFSLTITLRINIVVWGLPPRMHFAVILSVRWIDAHREGAGGWGGIKVDHPYKVFAKLQ